MKRLLSIFAVMAMVLSMQSCIGSSDTPDYNQSISLKGYNHVTEITSSSSDNVRLKAAKYNIGINMTANTLDLDITGAFDANGDETTMYLKNIKFSYSATTGFTFSLAEATPTSSDGTEHKITGLNGNITQWAIVNSDQTAYFYMSLLQISYTLDSKYDVFATIETSTGTSPEVLFTNCSTTTTAESVSPFSTTVTTYMITFNSTTSANVTLRSAQFSQRMPQTSMVFPNIPVTLTKDGYVLEAAEITPTINDTPMPSYKISNFKLEATNKGTVANTSFNCTISDVLYTVKGYGTMKAKSSTSDQ